MSERFIYKSFTHKEFSTQKSISKDFSIKKSVWANSIKNLKDFFIKNSVQFFFIKIFYSLL